MTTIDRIIRKKATWYGLTAIAAVITVIMMVSLAPTQPPASLDAAHSDPNLLDGQWSYLPGSTRQSDGLLIQSIDRRIVNQDGSGGQANPPINLYGTHLSNAQDFVINADIANRQGNATIQLYGQAPIIADEFRVERKSVSVTVSSQAVVVSVWNGQQQNPSSSASFDYHATGTGPQSIAIANQNGQITVKVGDQIVGKVNAKDVFSDSTVWFGFDATNSWLLQKLQAHSLTQQPLAIEDNSTLAMQNISLASNGLQQLASKKRKDFTVGAAMALGPAASDPQYAKIAFGGTFGALTTENALKWQFVHPQPNIYSFQEGDALVALAEAHHMSVFGHTLVFGEANPAWVRNLPIATAAQRDAIKQVMTGHISTVMGHYKGKISAWDVVDEPLADYDTFDASNNVFRQHKWYQAMGEDYIGIALRAARSADPNAKLFINEYGLESDGDRWDAFLALVTKLKQQGVPLDGIGFQSHVYDASDKISTTTLKKHFEALAKIGLVSRISEMDVYSDDGLTVQAQQYANAFDACLNEPSCVGFTTWGISDRYDTYKDDSGNIAYGQDLLWDSNMQATPAVQKIRSLLN